MNSNIQKKTAKKVTSAQKKRTSLKYSFLDGVFASGMNGFTQDYFTPILLHLGGSARAVGILSSLPNIVASLVQLRSSSMVNIFKSRKLMITRFVFVQALMLAAIAAMILFQSTTIILFIIFVILYSSSGAIANPVWSSMMADLIPENKRGKYFGWRNKVLGIIVTVCSISAGIMLNNIKKEYVSYGFVFLFSCAFVFRIISWIYLKKMYDPEIKHDPPGEFSLARIYGRFKASKFARFALFVPLLTFSVNMASPYFAVLMLKNLNFSYLQYSMVNIAAGLTGCLIMERWGKLADSIGTVIVLKITSPIIALLPLLWIINQNVFFLMGIQIISGFVWSGFNLSASNFIYDAIPPEKRVRYISYFNVFNGLMASAGAFIGGFIIQYLPPLFSYNILTLLVISYVLRMSIVLIFSFKLQEVRTVKKVSANEVFARMIGIKPLLDSDRKNNGELF